MTLVLFIRHFEKAKSWILRIENTICYSLESKDLSETIVPFLL